MLIKFRDNFLLEITVFASGSVVMIYEIIGSRILAPYIGTSTYVWTSLIGVILGSLSIGYWLGGKIADRRPNIKMLAAFLFSASVVVALTTLAQEVILFTLSTLPVGLELKSVIASIVLFGPASVLLGTVTPYAVRLKMSNVEQAGQTAGRLYALSTVGSIFGTFLSGFFLLPFAGSVRTLYLIIAVLFLTAALLVPFKISAKNIGALLLFLCAIGANEFVRYSLAKTYDLHDFDSQYSRIRVWSSTATGSGRPVRVVAFDPFSTQSSMFLDGDDVASRYVEFYHLFRHFKPDFQNTLVIGGAGYSFPKDYLRKYPGKKLDVVEIDPQMTKIARDYFRLPDNDSLQTYNEDGRSFLNRTENKYDAVVIDAFGSTLSIPFQLTTVEAVRKIDHVLKEDGVVVLNMFAAIRGDSSKFFQSEYRTYSEVFPHVIVFQVNGSGPGRDAENLILVASKSKYIALESNDDAISELLKNRYTGPLEIDMPILTDDLAPVEYYSSFVQKGMSLNEDQMKEKLNRVWKKIFGGGAL